MKMLKKVFLGVGGFLIVAGFACVTSNHVPAGYSVAGGLCWVAAAIVDATEKLQKK
jgi:hypothetical protein